MAEDGQGGAGPAGTAQSGEVIFLRDGQVFATNIDGSAERQLVTLAEGSLARNLTVSPDGSLLAFTVNNQEVVVQDLQSGGMSVLESADEAAVVSGLAWSLGGDVLYYTRVTLDPSTALPGLTQIIAQQMPAGSTRTVISETETQPGSSLQTVVAVDEQTLLGTQFDAEAGTSFVAIDINDGFPIIFAEGFLIWDVDVDGEQILLYSQLDLPTTGEWAPLPLYLLAAENDEPTLEQISPEGAELVYQDAKFSPDGSTIAALVFPQPAAGQPPRGNLVILEARGDGTYGSTLLTVDEDEYFNVAFTWAGNDGILVQRQLPGPEQPAELWYYPAFSLGSQQLTTGESPVVIP
ncbi:MAG: hypothetical protein GYB68_02095, partial [Chloroflexi bacterium]|nr:hypothetical protein [Chloroflexota bacterium]